MEPHEYTKTMRMNDILYNQQNKRKYDDAMDIKNFIMDDEHSNGNMSIDESLEEMCLFVPSSPEPALQSTMSHEKEEDHSTSPTSSKKKKAKVESVNTKFDTTNTHKQDEKVKLHPIQQSAIDSVQKGKNVFITGVAGTGKSVVLKEIQIYLQRTYQPDEWAAVAPTGICAQAIGGQTIHSFSGCGIPTYTIDFEKCWMKEKRDRWRKLKVLMVDEISMISGEFLDKLSDVISAIRCTPDAKENKKIQSPVLPPFGGIQLIFCGDFLQLPPISKKSKDIKTLIEQGNKRQNLHCDIGFAFQSNVWRKANFEVIQLEKVFRQDNMEFQKVLSEIRFGRLSAQSLSFLSQCHRPLLKDEHGIEVTKLYPRNVDVRAENESNLFKLKTALRKFQSNDSVQVYSDFGEGEDILWDNSFFKDCIAEKSLSLKKGAQVMLLRNIVRQGKVIEGNGSRGVIESFVHRINDVDNFLRHLDDEFSDCFWSDVDNFEVVSEDSHDEDHIYPLVQFRSGRRAVLTQSTFKSIISGIGVCIRRALPLRLAWAVSIHKSQGMTLDYVKTDLSKVFTEAQVYVALSRVKSEKGLELRGLHPRIVKSDERALAFYRNPYDEFQLWNEVDFSTDSSVHQPNTYGTIRSGTVVSLKGLVTSAERNGERGVIQSYNPQNGRYVVALEGSKETMSVKASNLLQHIQMKVHDVNSQPELNGLTGTIVAWTDSKERYNIYVSTLKKIVSLRPGTIVFEKGTVGQVVGLTSKTEFNGRWGTVKEWTNETNKYDIQLSSSQIIRIKVENLRV